MDEHCARRRSAAAFSAGIFIFFLLFASGVARADMKTGMAALEAGDFSEAYANLLPQAEAGNATAKFEIGSMLDTGLGTEIDAPAAAKWFRAAAEQGHVDAQHRIATYFEEGKGGPQDLARAALWYGRSASQGNAKAARNLAICI